MCLISTNSNEWIRWKERSCLLVLFGSHISIARLSLPKWSATNSKICALLISIGQNQSPFLAATKYDLYPTSILSFIAKIWSPITNGCTLLHNDIQVLKILSSSPKDDVSIIFDGCQILQQLMDNIGFALSLCLFGLIFCLLEDCAFDAKWNQPT
jgi:hypothetical protein